MTVKCEAMVEAASTLQASESDQASVVDDSSAKTIEFLRARLLSERAASKAARQEAQQIAEKVKDLHARLETEVEHRKEAEAAMGEVFTILKAKGLAVDGLSLASAGLKDEQERGVSPLDDLKETSKDRKDIPCRIVDPSINKEGPHRSLDKRDESTEKSMVESRKHVTNEPHSSNVENDVLSVAVNSVETCCNMRDAFLCNVLDLDVPSVGQTESRKDFSSQNTAEEHHYQVDDYKVQRTVINKPVAHRDHSSPDCSPECKKDSQTVHTIDQGLLKLKAMLHQIEEEVGALPKEQPLKFQLQGWVDNVASVLDKGKEAGLNGTLEIHSLDDSNKAGTNYPLKGATALQTKNVIHTELPILLTKKENAVKPMHGITEMVDTKEDSDKILSTVPQDMLQQASLLSSSNNYNGEYTSTMFPPSGMGPVLHPNTFHDRNPSCRSLNGSNRARYVLQDAPERHLHPQMMQCGISQTSLANPFMFTNGHASNGHCVGSESSYLVEVQSPKSSDVLSVGDAAGEMGYGHAQWNETRSQGRVSGLKREAGYREDALKSQYEAWSQARVLGSEKQAALGSREMRSNRYFVSDLVNNAPNELYMKQDRYFNHGNIQYERRHAISHGACTHVRGARESNMKSTAMRPTGLPLGDATLSLMDDRNGRLGDILMVLDAARQHVNTEKQSLYAEEPLIGPPKTMADARINRGYCEYGDEIQQVPYEYRNHTWRSRAHSQAPIIHFPPSPTSEQGYSPFERHGGHRRSSSVSTNFMMSDWESHLQARGEVHLGNGITLYTD